VQDDTRFEVQAWDTAVGTNNGDGIQQVDFEIIGPGGIIVLTQSYFAPTYCAFGNNVNCEPWDNTAFISFAVAPDGLYTIRARALSDGGVYTSWIEITFILAKAATATPTP